MFHGERFGYAHFLHQEMFRDVAFFASDVCCKYWPWAQRVAERFPQFDTGSTRPYLSVMHAFAHNYHCQVGAKHFRVVTGFECNGLHIFA